MENTFALSTTRIKQDVLAQCAWVDVTNITTLPPIVNPATDADIDATITAVISDVCRRLSGYIAYTTPNEELYLIAMNLQGFSEVKTHTLLQLICKYVRYGTLVELYSTQKQASHITSLFMDKRNTSMRRILQLLAYTN